MLSKYEIMGTWIKILKKNKSFFKILLDLHYIIIKYKLVKLYLYEVQRSF